MSSMISARATAATVVTAALLLALLLVTPQAHAATVYACVKKKSGTAHLFTKKPKCKKGETRISWNSQGVPGKNGAPGVNGTNGGAGTPGVSAPTTLPSGQSESGDYGASEFGAEFIEMTEGVTFPIPLAANVSKFFYTTTSGKGPNCSGPGHANPGYLCVYSGEHNEIEPPTLFNWEGTGKAETGLFGFTLEWETISKTNPAFDAGTWTVTAP